MKKHIFLFSLGLMFFVRSALAFDASVYVAPAIGNDSDIAVQVAKTIRDNYLVKTQILSSNCSDTSCQVLAASNTSAEVLLTFDITSMMGFYIADIRVYDISNNNAEIASAEAEGESLSKLTTNIKAAVMGLAKERFIGIQQREITLQKQIELNSVQETPNEPVTPSGTSNLSIGQRKGSWEISPFLGAEINNPMLNRLGVGLRISKSFSDTLAFEGFAFHAADLGLSDVKGLTRTLVQIAEEGSNDNEFQQPLDKVETVVTGGVRWIPIRSMLAVKDKPGKLKFDLYASAGLGMLSTNLYYAQYDSSLGVSLGAGQRQVRIPVTLGYGVNFYLSKRMTLDIGTRYILYQGPVPQYDPNNPVNENRLYSSGILHLGITMLQKDVTFKEVTTPFSFRRSGKGSDWPKQRFEAGLGMVTNDPFLSQKLINLSYIRYLKENLSLNLDVGYSPDLGDTDWKPLTTQLVTQNSVSPDISKLQAIASSTLGYEPFLYVSRTLKGSLGFKAGYGLVQTVDDLEALQAEGDERAVSTQVQLHPTRIVGAYITLNNKDIGMFSVHLDHMSYIETVNATTLEMKGNQIIKLQYAIPLGNGGK